MTGKKEKEKEKEEKEEEKEEEEKGVEQEVLAPCGSGKPQGHRSMYVRNLRANQGTPHKQPTNDYMR